MLISILHSFVNLFAGGRSGSKTILFFLYCLFLTFFLFYKKKLFSKFSVVWGFVALCLFYFYGIISHLFLSNLYGISPLAFSITGHNGELSSTTLTHIHEAKAALGYILAKVGLIHFQTLDAGGAYLGILPGWWLFVGALLLLIVLFYVFVSFEKLAPFYENKTKLRKIIFLFGYAIISFSLVKTGLDGGLFTPSLLALLLSLLLFLRFYWGKDNRVLLLVYFSGALLSVVCVLYFSTWAGGIPLMQASGTLMLVTVILLFFYTPPKKLYLFSAILLFFISWWLASTRDRDIYTYGALPIEKGEQYFSFNTKTNSIEEKTNEFSTTIARLVMRDKKNLSYAPIAAPGKTCAQGGLLAMAEATLLTKQSFIPAKDDIVRFVVRSTKETHFGYESTIRIVMPACLPEPLTVIDALLRKQNIDFYVMVNPVFYDESVGH